MKNSAPDDALRRWLDYMVMDFFTLKKGKLDPLTPPSLLCYHAQQGADKAVKAGLVFLQIPFPQLHDIQKLRTSLPAEWNPPFPVEDIERLPEYVVEGRYPGGWGLPEEEDAKWAVHLAEEIWRFVRARLIAHGWPASAFPAELLEPPE